MGVHSNAFYWWFYSHSTCIYRWFYSHSTPILFTFRWFYSHSTRILLRIVLTFYSHSTTDSTPIILTFYYWFYYWFYSHSTTDSTHILLMILLPFCGSATENYSYSTGDSTPFKMSAGDDYSGMEVVWVHLGVTSHSTQVHQSGFDPFKLDYRQSSVQLNCGRVSSDERHRATDPFLIDSPAPAFSYLIVGVRNILQSHKKFDWWEIHEIVYWWIRSHECWDYWEIAHTMYKQEYMQKLNT